MKKMNIERLNDLLKVTELKFELKQFGFYKKGKTEDICLCTQIHCFHFLLRKKYWVVSQLTVRIFTE